MKKRLEISYPDTFIYRENPNKAYLKYYNEHHKGYILKLK